MGDLINRNADNWRPLFAIADLSAATGRHVSARPRALAPRKADSIGTMLLIDIKATFDDEECRPAVLGGILRSISRWRAGRGLSSASQEAHQQEPAGATT